MAMYLLARCGSLGSRQGSSSGAQACQQGCSHIHAHVGLHSALCVQQQQHRGPQKLGQQAGCLGSQGLHVAQGGLQQLLVLLHSCAW